MKLKEAGSVVLEHLLLFAGVLVVLVAGLGTFIERMDEYYSNFNEESIDLPK